jgi:NifB/MoaA-like Fe-S oxidoreductase
MIGPLPGRARFIILLRSREALPVDASVTTALATLLGAATGGLTSVLATWLTSRTQAHSQWLEQQALRRRDLYNEFIETAARCFVHALQHEEADIPGLVDLYAKIDRMRILSSTKVVDIAERFAERIVDTYSEPNKSFVELREMINSSSVNLMREFSMACREEFEALRTV